jgi:hypothetical protein
MSVSNIGVQTVLPTTGTAQQPPAPQQKDKDITASPAASVRPPSPPGIGKLLDKVA